MYKYFFWFIYLLSLSPILSITDDENFGDLRRETQKFRLSFINITVGVNSIYFITYKNGDGLKLFKKLNLRSYQIKESEILDKVTNYRDFIASISNADINIHIKDLEYKIKCQEAIKNGSFSKMVAYNALTLLTFGLSTPYIINIYKITNYIYFYLFFITIFVYNFINIFLYILEFLKVKTVLRATFKDVKLSDKPLNEYAASLYFDWFSLKDEARISVSYVRNIEKYIKFIIFYFIWFICLYNVLAFNQIHHISSNSNPKTGIYAISIDLSLNENNIYSSQNLKELDKIRDGLITNKISQVIITKKPTLSGKELDVYQRLLSLLKAYNILNTQISEVNETSRSNIDDMSIIVLGR